MRVLGVDLTRQPPTAGAVEHTLVSLDDEGRLATRQQLHTLPAVTAAVAQLVGDEPFLMGVDVPVVVPRKTSRARPVENVVRRRLGYRLAPGGRAALAGEPLGIAGEALITGLATAGLPCLPYPDRDRRKSGLAETYPGLSLKALLWETSPLCTVDDADAADDLFRALSPPPYRAAKLRARARWTEQVVALDLVLRALGRLDGFDLEPVAHQLAKARSAEAVERAAALFDALLIAGTARRYLDSPETSVFAGDQENGYVILPADGLVRRLILNDTRPPGGELFPRASLKERLGGDARLKSPDLLSLPGQPERLEATFTNRPQYEFDNLDEMMWWKHCRHLSGPHLPVEGLVELEVLVGTQGDGEDAPLRLVRSRHRTLSFRFDPPKSWRRWVPTRDGKTYPMLVLRAVYDTLPAKD